MYDAIILGGGPAGMAAAVYFARQKMKFAILTWDVGGQALWSSEVEDYLGFHLLSGTELVEKFKAHLKDYEDAYETRENELATSVERIMGGFRVKTTKGSYETKTLLIATGTKHRELGVPGEKEFYGKGVTYCATCDAPLYRDKQVVVVGGGNSAMDAALFLDKYTDDITIVSLNAELMGDAIMKSKVLANPHIKVLYQTRTTGIGGEKFVTGVHIAGPDGSERDLPCQGVMIEIGLKPSAEFIDIVEKDKWGQIIVDQQNMTSVAGVFAAGDVTSVMQKQVVVAVGEGAKAALSLIKYLQSSS